MLKWSCLKYFYLLISSLFIDGNIQAQKVNSPALELLQRVDSVNNRANGIQFKTEMYARMSGNDYHQVALFKIQRDPLKIYYKQFERNPIELLYDETVNAEKALINPAGFPYANIWLSPYSPLILRRQHHSIFEADPKFILNQMFYLFDACKSTQCKISIVDTTVQHHQFKMITYLNSDYHIRSVTIKQSCSLLAFARTHHINFYSIILQNKNLSISSNLDKGDVVRIPSSYGKEIRLLIHPDTYIINKVEVYDKSGLYEQYKYLWYKNNVKFKVGTFHRDNESYNF